MVRMKDKVKQVVTVGNAIVCAEAVIRNVWLQAGKMYGKFNGRCVVSISRGIWQMV